MQRDVLKAQTKYNVHFAVALDVAGWDTVEERRVADQILVLPRTTPTSPNTHRMQVMKSRQPTDQWDQEEGLESHFEAGDYTFLPTNERFFE